MVEEREEGTAVTGCKYFCGNWGDRHLDVAGRHLGREVDDEATVAGDGAAGGVGHAFIVAGLGAALPAAKRPVRSPAMANERPLEGLRVIECAGWTGAFAGKLLADGGADVVRIVPPSGDPLASEPPFFGETGVSIQETWYNLGKRVVLLDLTEANGRAELWRLAAGADVLLEDWLAGSEPLTTEQLAANGRLARVSATHNGREVAPVVANDLVANALSGAASVTGDSDTPPLTGYGNQSYHTAGFYAAICALAAARSARLTGRSSHVDMSCHEALASCTEQMLMQWFFPGASDSGQIAPRQGALHWSGAYGVYPDRDGTGMHVTAALRFMEEILPWMVRDGAAQELTNNERFPTFLSIVQALPYVMECMKDWVAGKSANEMFFEAQERRLPWGPAVEIPAVAASPQVAARGFFAEREVPGVGVAPLPLRFFRTDVDGADPRAATRVGVRDLDWTPRALLKKTEATSVPGRPLDGVRILDFTHVLAGPFGTRALGDLGADVLKMSSQSRASGANNPGHPYYVSWNRNKRSLMVDMGQERGRALAREIAAKCDAITENFSAGVIQRWGMDRASLAEVNPKVTVVSMGGMGQSGPWKDFVTFAPTIHALTGLTAMTTFPDRQIIGYGFSLTDHLSGLAGAVAVLEGIEHAARTGQGLEVDLSQYELGLALMAPGIVEHLVNGVTPVPAGNRHPFGAWAPHNIYRASGGDKWVAIAVRGDADWERLCGAMGRPELAADIRFATHEARVKHEDELDAAVADWCQARDRYAVMEACQAAGIAAGAVQDARDLTEADAALAAREFFGWAEASGGTEGHGIDRFPALFDGVRPGVYRAAHQLGADTFEVLSDVLGIGDDEIADLMACGVLS